MSENGKTKLPISAVMVIYNEEKVLERALRSFYDLVDEIIIVHDGKCTDKSLEIAKKYTDKIFERKHIGSSEGHRPFAYQKAKNDWILQLDADEFLSEELRSQLGQLISADVDIYNLPWSTFLNQKHYFWYSKRALFRKSKSYFIGITHESIKPIDKEVKIKEAEAALLHNPPYNNLSYSVFCTKWKKLSRLQARQLLEDFSSIPKWNYPFEDLEQIHRIRIRHPILMGMIASSLYHMYSCAKTFLRHRNSYILRQGFFSFLYHIHHYYYLNKYKRNGTS